MSKTCCCAIIRSMVREIVKDKSFLSIPSTPCTEEDLFLHDDLVDTLEFHKDACVGMAANMIGFQKQAIVFRAEDDSAVVMFNPKIIGTGIDTYTAEEGCLSLKGIRKTRRYKEIDVLYCNKRFRQKTMHLEGFQAQIVQHEMDHLSGILI